MMADAVVVTAVTAEGAAMTAPKENGGDDGQRQRGDDGKGWPPGPTSA